MIKNLDVGRAAGLARKKVYERMSQQTAANQSEDDFQEQSTMLTLDASFCLRLLISSICENMPCKFRSIVTQPNLDPTVSKPAIEP